MKRTLHTYNTLLLRYRKYLLKLQRLVACDRNLQRQEVLKKHILRLYRRLLVLDVSIKKYAKAMALGLTLVVASMEMEAQIMFDEIQEEPFGLDGFDYRGAMAFGDLDNDGDQDFFMSTYSNGMIFRENIGNGVITNFSASQQINTIPFVYFPNLIDMDGDGDLDIIGLDYNYGGDGEISFEYAENIGSPEVYSFQNVVINPFNLETVLNSVALKYNSFAIADFDADGDFDMLVSSLYQNTNSELFFYIENIGDSQNPDFEISEVNPIGIFGVPHDAIGFSLDLNAGDIDNDGDVDLMGFDSFGVWHFVENQGTPEQFLFNVAQDQAFGLMETDPYSSYVPAAITDIDNDGDLDVFSVDFFYFQFARDIIVFQENTCFDNSDEEIVFDGPFESFNGLTSGGIISSDRVLPNFVDIDGDGDSDSYTYFYDYYNTIPLGLIYKENIGSPSEPDFSSNSSNISLPPEGIRGFSFGDIDNDGDFDLIADAGPSGFNFSENIGSSEAPQFSAWQLNPFGLESLENKILLPTFVDINNDGLLDISTGAGFSQNDDFQMLFFINEGTTLEPSFGAPLSNPYNLPELNNNFATSFSDIDMDGDFDMFVGLRPTQILYFENSGTPESPFFEQALINPFQLVPAANNFLNSFLTLSFADIDDDGDDDIHIGGPLVFNTQFYRNATISNSPDPLQFLNCGEANIPLGPDGTTTIDPIDLLLFNPCSSEFPFESIEASITEVDSTFLGSPTEVDITITVNGQTIVCTSTLTVVDLLFPFIDSTLEDDIVVGLPGDNFVILPIYTSQIIASDNVGIASITQEPLPGTEIPVNTTITVTLKVTDTSGNQSQTAFQFTAVETLAIDDIALQTLELYPNPGESLITILNQENIRLQQVQIIDITGKVVSDTRLGIVDQEVILDISKLAAGLYMVKIKSNQGTSVKKLIKK